MTRKLPGSSTSQEIIQASNIKYRHGPTNGRHGIHICAHVCVSEHGYGLGNNTCAWNSVFYSGHLTGGTLYFTWQSYQK